MKSQSRRRRWRASSPPIGARRANERDPFGASRAGHRLPVVPCTAEGALAVGILLLLIWTTAAIASSGPSQGTLVFLTQQALRSPGHAVRNLGGVLLLGALVGALIAICYNALRLLFPPRV